MTKKSKKTAGIILSAAAIFAVLWFLKKREKEQVDEYDWIMW